MAGEQSTNGAADCAPCANSHLTLKELVVKHNKMELVDKNKDAQGEMINEESIAETITNNYVALNRLPGSGNIWSHFFYAR